MPVIFRAEDTSSSPFISNSVEAMSSLLSAAPLSLPPGFHDALPPQAEREEEVIARLMALFHQHGYDRVRPSLVEYERSLFAAPDSEALRRRSLRISDPQSGRMLAVRPDITLQLRRLASTRLASQPRPLRLSYAGQALRLTGSALRPARQISQAGLELIGWPATAAPQASFEVLDAVLAALDAIGLARVTLDWVLPTLMPRFLAAAGLDREQRDALLTALDGKDTVQITALAGPHAEALQALRRAAGPWRDAWSALQQHAAIAPLLTPELTYLPALAERLEERWPEAQLMLDPLERRGFQYQTGLSFSLFAPGLRGEIGRGGHYRIGEEWAVGASLYVDSILHGTTVQEEGSVRLFGPDAPQRELDAARAGGERAARRFITPTENETG